MGSAAKFAAVAGVILFGRVIYMQKAIDIMARTMWGEARGEGPEAMRAVGHVIMNRAAKGGWWGSSVIAVALKPWQFSAWNENDPNRAKMMAVTGADPAFAQALDLAVKIYRGELPDTTGGATHYHTTAVAPNWTASGTQTAQIGSHVFYTGVA